jgi:hypothetical protein
MSRRYSAAEISPSAFSSMASTIALAVPATASDIGEAFTVPDPDPARQWATRVEKLRDQVNPLVTSGDSAQATGIGFVYCGCRKDAR